MASVETSKDKAEKRTSVIAAVSIGFVCLVVGLPLWWKTTEVYRVSLPYSAIQSLSQTKISYTVDLNIVSFVKELTSDDLARMSKHMMDRLDGKPSSEVIPHYRTTVREATGKEMDLLNTAGGLKGLDVKLSSLLQNKANNYHVILLAQGSPLDITRPTLGLHRCLFVPYNKQDVGSAAEYIVTLVKTNLIREGAVVKGYNSARGARNVKPDKESMRSVRSHPGYDVTLTLVIPRPDIMDVQWDIEHGVNAYLNPLVNTMAGYTQVNIKSQVLFFTKLQTKPLKDGTESYFTEKHLPHMINPLEAKLGSPASTNPELNFLVYVPTKDQYPLYIRGQNGLNIGSNSFLSPQWGGIFIYNIAPPTENDTLPTRPTLDIQRVMSVVVAQIRLLLNLHTQTSTDVDFLPVGNIAVTEWELDAWLRSRSVENLATSAATLRSLAELLEKISNIVINDDIGKQVELAVESMRRSLTLLQDGALIEAFLQSRSAIVASEKAFFDPSLLELLYFPEDQKFAIYIPLFLPISFPVIASLFQAYKWYKGQAKPKQD